VKSLHAQSLQLRFLAWVAGAALLFAALAGALAYQFGFHRAERAALHTLEGLLTAVEKTAAIGAYANDTVLLQEVAQGLSRDPQVRAVEILDSQGTALLQVQGQRRAALQAAPVVERPLKAPFVRDEQVGLLRIHVERAEVEGRAREQAWTLALLMAGQSLLIALVLAWTAQRLVSRPIVGIARQLHQLPPGTAHRLQAPASHEHDELGLLTRAVNALLQGNEQALQRERALRAEIEAMEAQYRQIFDSTSAGIFVLDREGRLINGNPTVLRVIGAPANAMKQLQGEDFVRRVFARPERVHAMIGAAAQRHETVSADLELLSRDQATHWVHCLISVQPPAPGQRDELVEGVMYDVTERKRAERAVQHRAEHDALTGLKNRAAGEAVLERFVHEASLHGKAVTLMVLDLDGFKQVNDVHGHEAGDEVLVQCARRMAGIARRASDLVARMGGDEFIVALYDCDVEDGFVAEIGGGLLQALREPVLLPDGLGGGIEVRVGTSIGIASFPRHADTAKALMQRADEVMYEVKRNGKNAYAVAWWPPGRG